MRSIEVTAKSVDEAIFMGIDQLGLSIDQVDIEIIEEGGRRLFGIGSKQCVVRLTERAPEEVERVLEEQEKQAEQEAQETKERQQARTRERGRKEPRGRRAQRTAPPAQDGASPSTEAQKPPFYGRCSAKWAWRVPWWMRLAEKAAYTSAYPGPLWAS